MDLRADEQMHYRSSLETGSRAFCNTAKLARWPDLYHLERNNEGFGANKDYFECRDFFFFKY